MSEAIEQEVKRHRSLQKIANESEEVFDKLAGSRCDHFAATIDKFDGERITECKHSAHPYAKGALAECVVNLCPLCK